MRNPNYKIVRNPNFTKYVENSIVDFSEFLIWKKKGFYKIRKMNCSIVTNNM